MDLDRCTLAGLEEGLLLALSGFSFLFAVLRCMPWCAEKEADGNVEVTTTNCSLRVVILGEPFSLHCFICKGEAGGEVLWMPDNGGMSWFCGAKLGLHGTGRGSGADSVRE